MSDPTCQGAVDYDEATSSFVRCGKPATCAYHRVRDDLTINLCPECFRSYTRIEETRRVVEGAVKKLWIGVSNE